jgi:hypothetical protein
MEIWFKTGVNVLPILRFPQRCGWEFRSSGIGSCNTEGPIPDVSKEGQELISVSRILISEKKGKLNECFLEK